MNYLLNKYKFKNATKQEKLPFIYKNVPFILFYGLFIWLFITKVRSIYTVCVGYEKVFCLACIKKGGFFKESTLFYQLSITI